MTTSILQGDCIDVMRTLADQSVHCCVTSPPYWRQRDYGCDGQIGLEQTPQEYVDALSRVFSEVRRVLRPDGSLWINIGDKWASGGNGGGGSLSVKRRVWREATSKKGWRNPPPGFKDKDLVLAGFMVAERLRQDGWFLRKTIIWSKCRAAEPARMDRPSVSHEYVFLFSKRNDSQVRDPGEPWWKSSVWDVSPSADKLDHPAVMPRELVRRCILAGCPAGGTVLDPFGGAGTTGLVAQQHGRNAILAELNPAYIAIAQRRLGLTPEWMA